MIAVSPGSSRLTKHASMPAEPVPLIGSVSALSVRKTEAQPVRDLVEHDEEVGVEVPEHGALERFHDLGIRVRRPGPEQQPISVEHAGRLPPASKQQQGPGEETREPDHENAAHLATGEGQRAGAGCGRRLRPDHG